MIGTLMSLVLAFGVIAEQPQDLVADTSSHSLSDVNSVDPKDSVITISGICGNNSLNAGDTQACNITISKEQFERLMNALAAAGQPIPKNGRRQLAQTYVDLLAYEQAARSSGLESSPEFQDLMTLVRLRTVSELHRRNLQARFQAPSKEDIDQYYKQNPSNFTEVKLRRMLIPRKSSSADNQQEYEKRALEAANILRERAAQGADCDQLQKEVYARLTLASPPATDMGYRRKANLLAESRDEIFALEPGEVSKVEQENFSFVIYKLERKKLLPEEEVKEEISREIARQRLQTALEEINSSVHPIFNQQYFGSEPSLPANPSASSSSRSQQPDPMPH